MTDRTDNQAAGGAARPRVKVCGLTHPEDVAVAVRAGADAVGVISGVPVDSPREVSPARADELLTALAPFVTGVLVTMVEEPAALTELVERVDPDAVQLHGDPANEACEAVRATDRPLLVSVGADELAGAGQYAGTADALVVDSVDEKGAGGTGRTHDWERTRELAERLEIPVVLAGGLTPENVAEAVETAEPFAVDVASGVEAEPGRKNPEAVKRFVSRAIAGRALPAEGGR